MCAAINILPSAQTNRPCVIYFQCDPGSSADAFFDFVYRKPTMTMLIGSSCSEVTETIGEIAPYWNLILVSALRSQRDCTLLEPYSGKGPEVTERFHPTGTLFW